METPLSSRSRSTRRVRRKVCSSETKLVIKPTEFTLQMPEKRPKTDRPKKISKQLKVKGHLERPRRHLKKSFLYSTVHKDHKRPRKGMKSTKKKIEIIESETSSVSILNGKVSQNWVFRWTRLSNVFDFAPDIWLQRWVRSWLISHRA